MLKSSENNLPKVWLNTRYKVEKIYEINMETKLKKVENELEENTYFYQILTVIHLEFFLGFFTLTHVQKAMKYHR